MTGQNGSPAREPAVPATRDRASGSWIGRTQQTVSRLFAGRVTEDRVPSTSFAVFGPEGIVYADGFGTIPATGAAPTLDTAYRIASCTKSFTAAALMVARDRGEVRLTDTVSDWLAAGPLTGPDSRPVPPPSLADLASMAAGLPTDDPWADRQEAMSARDFDRMVATGLRFTASPGDRYEYSNLGYALLGRCLEQATGKSLRRLVTAELLNPLGLDGVGFDTSVTAESIAAGQHKVAGTWVELAPTRPGSFSAIGGIYATARSLSAWGRWLAAAMVEDREDPIGTPAQPPLSRASRVAMQTTQTPMPAEMALGGTADQFRGYGFGLQIWQHRRHGGIVQHSGGYPGYGCHMRWHPDSGIGVVGLENATYSGPVQPVGTALDLILDEVLGSTPDPQVWPETAAARLSVERLIRCWDPHLAADLFADNVDLDEPLTRRRDAVVDLVAAVGPLDDEPLPLAESAPISTSPARLAWSIPGDNGLLRCEISLTPEGSPRVQKLTVRRG